MAAPRAILDTSALICLHHLGLLQHLHLFYEEVRLPSEVEREFVEQARDEEEKSRRFDFMVRFYQGNDSWFVPCNAYGEDLVQLYLTAPKMNRGEAEALAQNQFYENGYEVILDEQIARSLARSRSMKIRGTLALLAHMELGFGLCDYATAVQRLRTEAGTRFSDLVVGQVYADVRSQYQGGK